MERNEEISLEKIALAGIGAITKTAEVAGDLIDELVKKGAMAVEQGEALNKELKHEIEESNEAAQTENASVLVSFIEDMAQLTTDELAAIRVKLEELESTKGSGV